MTAWWLHERLVSGEMPAASDMPQPTRAADDFASIAKRLKEIEAEKAKEREKATGLVWRSPLDLQRLTAWRGLCGMAEWAVPGEDETYPATECNRLPGPAPTDRNKQPMGNATQAPNRERRCELRHTS